MGLLHDLVSVDLPSGLVSKFGVESSGGDGAL